MNTKPIGYNTPTLVKIRTKNDKKEHFINSSMIVAFEPSKKDEDTDIVLLNGKIYTIKGTPAHHAESYRQDYNQGNSILNLLR